VIIAAGIAIVVVPIVGQCMFTMIPSVVVPMQALTVAVVNVVLAAPLQN
jgi:hypothetical protein